MFCGFDPTKESTFKAMRLCSPHFSIAKAGNGFMQSFLKHSQMANLTPIRNNMLANAGRTNCSGRRVEI